MPVYFILSDQINHKTVNVGPELEHHLRNVLRLKVGEALCLVDEQPKQYLARVTASHPGPMRLQIENEIGRPEVRSAHIRLGVGCLKREKMDWIVQKATELGVSRISPLITDRTIIRPQPDRTGHQLKRWTKIATEAAQQSCRWDIPKIDPPIDLKTLFAEKMSGGFRFIFSEYPPIFPCRETIQNEISGTVDQGTLLIGPEGGWSPSEITEARHEGFSPLSLGERILRTETAVLAALAIIQYEISNGNTADTTG